MPDCLQHALFFSFLPIERIHSVEIGRMDLANIMWVSYYRDSGTFKTASFDIYNMKWWQRAFQSLGIEMLHASDRR